MQEGTEVVQLYLERPSDSEGPQQTLRGFRRVQLAPGASDVLLFELAYDDFAWFNPATNRMEPLKGEYIIRVGGSSNKAQHRTLRIELR